MIAKQIIKITLNLTVICFFAGTILGLVNMGTQHAKEENQHKREVLTSMSLLGYGAGNPAPADLKMDKISRYLLAVDGAPALGYVIPAGQGQELIILSVEGGKLLSIPAPQMENPEINQHLSQEMRRQVSELTHVEDYRIALLDGKVQGYLITGNNLGFKANIKMMVALNSDFSVRGIAILESEEDPGLGDEAKEPYFRNQFAGKSAAQLARISISKNPQPEEYRSLLESQPEGHFTAEEMENLRAVYGDSPIYSITGSTISSTAVMVGVQKAVGRFVYRLQQVNAALTAPSSSAPAPEAREGEGEGV
ncbi:MAG: FMN-binding protein [Desulfarculales bacterium]|jgi:electron transport complex protein RnfG|nr:FMN-binding protein [Desulfarculales bacterium]